MTLITPLKPPRSTANPSPIRRPGSVRRTSSVDFDWVDGPQSERRLHGRARDYITPLDGGPGQASREATLEASLDVDRTITAIAATPAPAHLQALVGERGGGHLRMVLREKLPELHAEGHPLYLLLDDISGTSLISSWGWSLWNPDWLSGGANAIPPEVLAKMMRDRAGVCWGLQIGHSGMSPNRAAFHEDAADGGDLRNPADPEGWHEFPPVAQVSMRRARRIDVWRDPASGLIHLDSAFQDSAPRPAGGRAALHEYRLTATVDPQTMELLSLEPEPRVLPFVECPGAVGNARGLVGTPLPKIREAVLNELRGAAGCTHLNDALRALAEVPMLVGQLAG
jgi:hypothetical protein